MNQHPCLSPSKRPSSCSKAPAAPTTSSTTDVSQSVGTCCGSSLVVLPVNAPQSRLSIHAASCSCVLAVPFMVGVVVVPVLVVVVVVVDVRVVDVVAVAPILVVNVEGVVVVVVRSCGGLWWLFFLWWSWWG